MLKEMAEAKLQLFTLVLYRIMLRKKSTTMKLDSLADLQFLPCPHRLRLQPSGGIELDD